ncbi:MAG TPA: hypothetical protein VF043_18050 [Ktedonobacteraceae bacterium]
MIDWPSTLTINAWTGEEPGSGDVSEKAKAWALRTGPPEARAYLPVPPAADPANWRDPRIGWGLILAESDGHSDAELAAGIDAPEAIQALLKARGNAPVFRYMPKSSYRLTHLRNHASQQDVAISGTPMGLGDGALPKYLLIYGPPTEIPWELQYILNATRVVGRVDLEGDALNNYVQALINEWKDAASCIDQAVVWAADFGPNDISHLMRDAIAARVYEKWHGDPTLQDRALFLDGPVSQASSAALISAVSQRKPALIVTTSHGQTGPLSDPLVMKSKLGLPVGQDYQALNPDQLLAAWEPDGAIWYAHACCSAGSDAATLYGCLEQADPALCLVKTGSPIDRILRGVAGLGALVAPLPKALLGAKKPLRAFIGHVEPTFDWTIRQPATGQFLTDALGQALYNNVYKPMPIGLAFADWYGTLAGLSIEYERVRNAYNKGEDTLNAILYCQLATRDRQSMVILGDPTVMLPKLP